MTKIISIIRNTFNSLASDFNKGGVLALFCPAIVRNSK